MHCLGYVSADVPTTEQYGKHDVEVEVMICQTLHLISCYAHNPIKEHIASKLLMHEHNNPRKAWHFQCGT